MNRAKKCNHRNVSNGLALGLCLAFASSQVLAEIRPTIPPKGAPAHIPSSLEEIEKCDEPVVMLVIGELTDEAFQWEHPSGKNYAKELRSARLYERFGGHYMISSTKILETFENPYPGERFTLMAEWPCLEAAQGFFYSPEYQEIIPLREGSGTFQFTVYPKRTVDDMYYRQGQ